MMRSSLPLCALLLATACGPKSPPTKGPSAEATSTPTTDDGEPGEAVPSNSASDPSSDSSSSSQEFQLGDSATAGDAHGATPSKIEATATHAAVKFFVVSKDDGSPIPGIVISLKGPEGDAFYTEETDAAGYAEVLLPIGRSYEVVYLSLGRKDVSAKVEVPNRARQNLKLTLRYKRFESPATTADGPPPSFRLDEVNFASGSAKLLPESVPRLESVVEYMTHVKSARIEIAGHTDNVGSAKKNKALSLKRAQAVREHLIAQGIDGERIEAVGYGDEQPISPNDSDAGRKQNRRIEAREL